MASMSGIRGTLLSLSLFNHLSHLTVILVISSNKLFGGEMLAGVVPTAADDTMAE